MEKWSEYQEHIKKETVKIVAQEDELVLYNAFSTLDWTFEYFIVLYDRILSCSEDFPFSEFVLTKNICTVLEETHRKPDLPAGAEVKTISADAFKDCSDLQEIKLPEGAGEDWIPILRR